MEQLLLEQRGQACDKLFAMQPNRIALERPDAQFGDYAVNVAMQLAKPLGRPPRDIAQELVSIEDMLRFIYLAFSRLLSQGSSDSFEIVLPDCLFWLDIDQHAQS